MRKIHRLSPDIASQIAAGEVVERPSSVVKELVENAIDSGASRIEVRIEQGGLSKITVRDDGEGMTPEDALLAVERHATSKIQSFHDLDCLTTLGFRGEALPSISSVASMTLITRTQEAAAGVELRLEGGEKPSVRPCGAPVGTTVEVRELFSRVPARLKFLKSKNTEGSYITESMMLAALARPEITFVLYREGRKTREYLRTPSVGQRVQQVLGQDPSEFCKRVRASIGIEAYLSKPDRTRVGASGLYLFVNRRPIRDRQLARAICQAYGPTLEVGRYPVGAFFLDVPHELVDVNVHPQKAEVRFADPRGIFTIIVKELQLGLTKTFLWSSPNSLFSHGGPSSEPSSSSQEWSLHTTSGGLQREQDSGAASSSLGGVPQKKQELVPYLTQFHETAMPSSSLPLPLSDAIVPFPSSSYSGNRPVVYRKLKFLAQLKATFLLCEGEDALYILDQHAAAERVTFDRLRQAYLARDVPMQCLLIPEVIALAPPEIACLEEQEKEIEGLGIELRQVGGEAVAIHAVPSLLQHISAERIVRDLLAELGHHAKRPFTEIVDRILATLACHGSVRAGDSLSPDEVAALLKGLDRVDFAAYCPHGRPVLTRLSFEELERRVGRS
ncbi:DNA mismatch repair endonuclease MutL [Pajaroellobacter abortibovis]|uniref:DNA mismatch repair protein MutL n=1 Tax=Pajaroellobacter abortibovis TaxID=1882918 RepID=A0A1L6MYW5_9BACT|nr:DNA mismatch repair endonuclease MutL [Pajaroellobacter abortibovis]APS00657.1 hypothetical protein BCY86_08210 [Pajaroellobacter abortibovis]